MHKRKISAFEKSIFFWCLHQARFNLKTSVPAILLVLNLPHKVQAVDSSQLGRPKACIAAEEALETVLWGSERGFSCMPHTAAYGSRVPALPGNRALQRSPVLPECCPLPSRDILTAETIEASEVCPRHYVLVSGGQPCGKKINSVESREICSGWITCRKINTKRYQLGKQTEGVYWGYGSSYWKNSRRIMKSDIPSAIRDGLGRVGKFHWKSQGCVGFPFGSLLVGKRSKRCDGQLYRRLEYKGAAGDPPSGTPVIMFPSCKNLDNVFSLSASCERI